MIEKESLGEDALKHLDKDISFLSTRDEVLVINEERWNTSDFTFVRAFDVVLYFGETTACFEPRSQNVSVVAKAGGTLNNNFKIAHIKTFSEIGTEKVLFESDLSFGPLAF
jgi:hypothetical protein